MNAKSIKEKDVVLVVEDDAKSRKLLAAQLAMEGLSVLTAANGAEGVRVACEMEPDIIHARDGWPGCYSGVKGESG